MRNRVCSFLCLAGVSSNFAATGCRERTTGSTAYAKENSTASGTDDRWESVRCDGIVEEGSPVRIQSQPDGVWQCRQKAGSKFAVDVRLRFYKFEQHIGRLLVGAYSFQNPILQTQEALDEAGTWFSTSASVRCNKMHVNKLFTPTST